MSRSVRIVVRVLGVLILVTLIVWLVLYAFFRPVQSSEPDAQLPNPAAVYCEEQGSAIQMRKTADGGSTVCACCLMEVSATNGHCTGASAARQRQQDMAQS